MTSHAVISAIKWVPRNYLMTQPVQYALNEEEAQQMQRLAGKSKADGRDDNEEEEERRRGEEEEEEEDDEDMKLEMAMNAMYLEKDGVVNETDSDLGSDADDTRLKYTDQILVSATIEDEQASLEMNVYDTETGSLYIHHDITLPAYPLCLEFLGVDGVRLNWTNEHVPSRSFVAVGTIEPHIEVWTLDVIDSLEPSCVLEGHKDAVMSLHWNGLHQQYLASGSADKTVGVWDLPTGALSARLSALHDDKIQVVQWNPAEASVLLTGSFDGTCCVADVRVAATSSPSSSTARFARKKGNGAGVESACWDPFNPAHFAVSYEDGIVAIYDARAGGGGGEKRRPLCAFDAVSGGKACASVVANKYVKSLWASCGSDRRVKLWDLGEPTDPKLLRSRKLTIGKLFSCDFAIPTVTSNEDEFDPFLVGVGGSKGHVGLWHANDLEEEQRAKSGVGADEEEEEEEDEDDDEEEEEPRTKKSAKKNNVKKDEGKQFPSRRPLDLNECFAGRIFKQPKSWSNSNSSSS